MKSLKKIVTIGLMVLTVSAISITAFAASGYNTPAEAVAGIIGRTVESVTEERAESGKTFGNIASEAGKLDEFKAEMLEMKKDRLAAQVAEGKITKEKADEIIAAIEANMANCDGTGSGMLGRKMGAKFGSNGEGLGNGGANRGNGMGRGQGRGLGKGQGNSFGMGACVTGK